MENGDGSNFGDGTSIFPIKKFDAMEVLICCRAGITCLQLPGTFIMSLIVLVITQMSCYNSIPKYSRMIMCSSLPILYPRAIFTTVMVATLQLDHATKKWLGLPHLITSKGKICSVVNGKWLKDSMVKQSSAFLQCTSGHVA